MKITAGKVTAAIVVGLGIGVFVILRTHPRPPQDNPETAPVASASTNLGQVAAKGSQAATVAPFIVKDTDTDSPGTNVVTRIVTITAEVGGTPPVALQWKVDKGSGFVPVVGATQATFRIGNAQVADSGLYSLFATNSAGHTNTTPVPLIVSEGED